MNGINRNLLSDEIASHISLVVVGAGAVSGSTDYIVVLKSKNVCEHFYCSLIFRSAGSLLKKLPYKRTSFVSSLK